MHRQSLGSPASKLQCHGILISGAGVIKNDNENDNNFISDHHRKDKSPSTSTDDVAVNEEHKLQKSNQQIKSLSLSSSSSSSSSSSRLVHLIPILTLFCFLILYLSSHDPSTKDAAQFSGFTTISSETIAIDSIGLDDNVGDGSTSIRSNRKLQQVNNKNDVVSTGKFCDKGKRIHLRWLFRHLRIC